MKQIIFSALAIVGMFSFISCERHEWEDTEDGKGTKRLYPKQEHGHGAHDSHGGHEAHEGDEHGKDEHAGHDHDKNDSHDHAKDGDQGDHKH